MGPYQLDTLCTEMHQKFTHWVTLLWHCVMPYVQCVHVRVLQRKFKLVSVMIF